MGYERVLVPTDGSEVAAAAIRHAVDAATADAEVHALYVVDVDAVSYGLGTEQVDRVRQGRLDEMDDLRDRAEAATGAVADAAADAGLDAVETVEVGQPHAVIADYAADHDVDLIAMGSHGRAGVQRAVLGSVTERVLRTSDCPVLVVDAGD